MSKMLPQTLLAAFLAIFAHTSVEGGGVMLINMRNAMMCGKQPIELSSYSYIQDDILAMWDGIENYARGVHDSTLNGWNDISGNNHSITQKSTSGTHPTWNDNALVLSTGNKFAYGNGDVIFTGKSAATFESVFDVTQTTYFIPIGAFRQNRQNIRIQINRQQASEGGVVIPVISNLTDGTKTGLAVIPTANWKYLYSNIFSGVITIDENNLVKFYANGELYVQFQLSVTFSSTYASRYGFAPFYDFDKLNDTWDRGTAKAHAFRLHGRVLTAAEIAANYAVDKARFNLPDAN